ncbi:MAG: pyridoxal-phosphate-dependent aminotransferase family protein [Tagaea sp.]
MGAWTLARGGDLPQFPGMDRFPDLNPPARLLMGPGPINADPRVLRAMATPLLGQFDPAMTALMNETMALYRGVFKTANKWTMLIDGTARAGIEAAMVSLIEPGDKVLVPVFGRFGHLKAEIARRCDADVVVVEREWGTVFPLEEIRDLVKKHRPKLLAMCQGDTSTTMLQPLAGVGAIAREFDCLFYTDTTASLGGNDLRADEWAIDLVSSGLQKCLAGPSGSAPVTIGPRAEAAIRRRRHVELGIATANDVPGNGARIRSNYFDLAMIMDYWSEKRLNHHTEATSMLYASRECAKILVEEGLDTAIERHRVAGIAMAEGLKAMGLKLFGDQSNKMNNVVGIHIPAEVQGDAVRKAMLDDFSIEIGTSFGPLHGKIWRIGTMGYNARKDCVTTTLAALESVLGMHKAKIAPGQAVPAALAVFRSAEAASAKAAE